MSDSKASFLTAIINNVLIWFLGRTARHRSQLQLSLWLPWSRAAGGQMVFQQGANLSLVTQQDHQSGILTTKNTFKLLKDPAPFFQWIAGIPGSKPQVDSQPRWFHNFWKPFIIQISTASFPSLLVISSHLIRLIWTTWQTKATSSHGLEITNIRNYFIKKVKYLLCQVQGDKTDPSEYWYGGHLPL